MAKTTASAMGPKRTSDAAEKELGMMTMQNADRGTSAGRRI